MEITSSGKRYKIWLRGGFSHIKTSAQFERTLRAAFVKRYGAGADIGRSIHEMDSLIGMISKSIPADQL